jgi:hypothetical protein
MSVAGKDQMKPGPNFGPKGGPEGAGPDDQEQKRPDAMEMVKKAEKQLGTVEVVYGPHDVAMDFAGLTVAEAENALRDLLGVEKGAEAYLDGNKIDNKSGTTLKGGQRLEFMKEAGQKG